jgi:hypothetical protein
MDLLSLLSMPFKHGKKYYEFLKKYATSRNEITDKRMSAYMEKVNILVCNFCNFFYFFEKSNQKALSFGEFIGDTYKKNLVSFVKDSMTGAEVFGFFY